MRTISRLLCLASLLALFCSSLGAQRGGGRFADRIDQLVEQLDLTPAQQEQVAQLRAEQRAKFLELRAANTAGEGSTDEMRALFREAKKRFVALLTPQQRQQLQELRRQGHQSKSEAVSALRQELKRYRHDQILPALQRLRTDFDKNLNPTERQQLSTLRASAKAELGIQSPSPQRATREDWKAFRTKHAAELSAVRAIAETHRTELETVRDALRQNKQRWRQDLRAIRARHTKDAWGDEQHQATRQDDRTPMKGGALMFLLLDPDQLDEADAASFDESAAILVFPNPADGAATVAFETRTAGKVSIIAIDATGRTYPLFDRELSKGEHQIEVQLPSDNANAHSLQVIDATGVRTAQLPRG